MLRIVIADDEQEARDNMLACIDWDSLGLTISGIASDGISALEIIMKEKPEIVFLDIRMPGMNGLEVIEKIYENSFFPSVIIISGYDDFIYAKKAIQLCAVDFILKPFCPADLLNIIKKTIRRIDIVKKLAEKNSFFSHYINSYEVDYCNDSINIFYPANEEREVIKYILTGSLREAKNSVDKFINSIKKINNQNISNFILIDCCMILYSEICRILFERGKLLKVNHFESLDLSHYRLIELMRKCFHSVIDETYAILNTISESKLIVNQAINIIENHYSEKISLQIVAQKLYVSAPYLSSLFTKHLNINFTKYLQNTRVEHAKNMLLNPHMKIGKVAEKVGYDNAKYFSQLFKKATGLTPQEYHMSRKS